MIRLYFLITLAAIKAAHGSGFKPMTPESWNEATYLTYIKSMAMYPQMTPMSRQEFEKAAINREGKIFDFGDFEQKFDNFEHTLNVNPQTTNQNVHSLGNLETSASNLGANTQFLHNQNFGNPQGVYIPQLAVNSNPQNFGGVLTNQKHGIFGGILPPINVQTTAPEKFQSAVDLFMGTPGANSDVINLLREQQKQQVLYPYTSYGSPISGSYPQPPPPPSAQQEEILKLMKLLLLKIDAQATTPKPTVQSKPEFEFKLSIPKHSQKYVDTERDQSSLLKQFDFGPGAEIISNPVKSLGDYRQRDSFQKFKDDEYHFHAPPTKFEHVHVNPMKFRLPMKQPEKFHHRNNAPNRFQNGFRYPSLTHEGYRKPPQKRNPRSGKSNPGYRFKIKKA